MKQDEYKISVITPFHNVNLAMFAKSCESMINQTYGFEKIQWVIVVHNSDPEYLQGVRSLVGGYENVLIEELKNEHHTPSSPRNRGVELATGKYVAYLDGDDSYTLNCFQKALPCIEESGSQILCFRREYEMASADCLPVTEKVLWNQTKKLIVLDREDWDSDKMFNGLYGFVTSRIFDRRFLLENGIKFDESIAFGEDFHYIVNAYGHAKRVCYTPQLIGYHYYINGDSLVQSGGSKSGSTLVEYAKGYAKIFSSGIRLGIDMNNTINTMMPYLMQFIMASESCTAEDRRAICEILEPYIRMARPMKPSKIASREEVERCYSLTRILLEENANPASGSVSRVAPSPGSGEEVLLGILADNKDTDWGEAHEFGGIHSLEGYMARVPLTRYEDYASYIKLTTGIGETGIFTAYPMACYTLTSGTIGVPRLIPCTRPHLSGFMSAFSSIVGGKKTFLLFESLPRATHFNDDTYLSTISGAVLYYYMEQEKNAGEGLFTSPRELLFPPEAVDTNFPRLLFAIADPSVEQIVSTFTWGIVDAFGFLEKNWESLCDSLETGVLSGSCPISPEFRACLEGRIRPDAERARELREIFSHGFEEPVAQKIWPRLSRVVAGGSGEFEIYTHKMRRYIGDLPHSNGIYAASEALVGVAEGDESIGYVLKTDENFFEFLPISHASEDVVPVTADKLMTNHAYELIVTNKSGLYRYRLGDVIRVINLDGDAPLIGLSHRVDRVGRLGGFTLTDHDVYCVVMTVEQTFGLDFSDFAYCPDEDESRYEILLEPSAASLGKLREVSCREIALLFNRRLEQVSPEYKAAKSRHDIGDCVVSFSQPETHLLYRDLERMRKKIAPDQIKPIHYIDNPVREKFFKANLLSPGEYGE